jgi:hypothetical protein
MDETAQLAGFVASQAILCVSRGESLTVPLLVIDKEDGSTQFVEVKGQSSEEAVRTGERLIKQRAPGARRAVLAVEAYLNLPTGRTDAIFLHARCYKPEQQALMIAVPFRPASHPDGFAVFRPKFIAYEEGAIQPSWLDAFRRGVRMHAPGDKVWRDHLDESR